MLLLAKVSILMSALSIFERSVTTSISLGDECETPDKSPGKCIELEKCKEVLTEIKASPSFKKNISSYHCGFNGKKAKICCPLELNIRSSDSDTDSNSSVTIDNKYGSNNDVLPNKPADISTHPNLHLLPSACGQFDTPRIYGGNKTSVFDYPWMALLFYRIFSEGKLDYNCGGTIINDRYILTAAHCFKDTRYRVFEYVRIGEHNTETLKDCDGKDDCAPPHQNFGFEKIITHEKYTKNQIINDIALIRLNATITYGDNRYPICLPTTTTLLNLNVDGYEMIVAGWGKTENSENPSKELLMARLPIVENANCKEAYRNVRLKRRPVQIVNSLMCAGGREGVDSCIGDSGGPLMLLSKVNGMNKFVEFGIVNSGTAICGILNIPGLYTRVSYHMEWILDHLEP